MQKLTPEISQEELEGWGSIRELPGSCKKTSEFLRTRNSVQRDRITLPAAAGRPESLAENAGVGSGLACAVLKRKMHRVRKKLKERTKTKSQTTVCIDPYTSTATQCE